MDLQSELSALALTTPLLETPPRPYLCNLGSLGSANMGCKERGCCFGLEDHYGPSIIGNVTVAVLSVPGECMALGTDSHQHGCSGLYIDVCMCNIVVAL